ncbi:NYN domain-containing protein [Caballeronia sp. LZ033]|uniref:NYN domain-containing protein n=1 Tax=Caballeronia sp. LZ033 TaxID=3038566 RepID=UPI002859DE1A|nr:NYN domain-containing protein [Caballeronia sp. LZ033]MDR5817000.1 NYN domain-containing protein [Caballeronia sp. LZ033]
MAGPQESVSMAVFCDFENVALGVRDANYDKFDIRPVLERLLLKGSIVVKKAYCDWDRYKSFKASMHEASFELIEIPHVRQSGKNSADIRLVVDALDLCYTKSHVDTFVIVSGDSDFSPLVSKLRENAKKVIGVGVKNSTSDLLVANCDEFIFYDDLVREQQRAAARRESRETREPKRASEPKQETEARKSQAIAITVETFEALASERGESGKIWASVLKSAIKRRKPGFSETQYGFKAFGNLLDEAQSRGLLEVGRDDKSGAFVFRSAVAVSADVRPAEVPAVTQAEPVVVPSPVTHVSVEADEALPVSEAESAEGAGKAKKRKAAAPRRARKSAARQAVAETPQAPQAPQAPIATQAPEASAPATDAPVEEPAPAKKSSRKSSSRAPSRARRSRKSEEKPVEQ